MASGRYPDDAVQVNPTGGGSAQYGYNAAWTPPNLTALPLWLDGLDVNLLANVGIANDDAIGTWKNKGSQGSGNDVVQAVGGSKPTFKTGAVNGHAAVLFTAAQFLAGALSAVAAQAARHLFAVINMPASGGGYFYISRNGVVGSYSLVLSGDSTLIETNGVDTNNTIPAVPTTGPVVVEFSFDGVTTNKPTFVINGVSKVVSNGVGTGVGTETAGAGTLIGNSLVGFASHICEILVYNAVQSAAVALELRRGLSQKWGIAIT